MTDASKHILVLTTCPDGASASRLAGTLVTERLAACVNLLPGARSVYRWQGEVEQAEEHVLLIKTARRRYTELAARITQDHPYELPEVIVVPIETGSSEYLAWIDAMVEK